MLGAGDTGNGGSGADVFALREDVTDRVTIEDFDATVDSLVIEANDADDVTILSQTLTADGLVISFSSGADVVLAGVIAPIDESLIQIETPGTSTTS